jgi:DNA-binding CsgD family transcriptional regulator
VRTVAKGGFTLSADLANLLQAELASPLPPEPCERDGLGLGLLSPREEQALELIAQGFTHAQVARRMAIRKATVDTYVERIRAKLQVGNKAELTRAALELARQAEARESTRMAGEATGFVAGRAGNRACPAVAVAVADVGGGACWRQSLSGSCRCRPHRRPQDRALGAVRARDGQGRRVGDDHGCASGRLDALLPIRASNISR